jgi:hypothetical protein
MGHCGENNKSSDRLQEVSEKNSNQTWIGARQRPEPVFPPISSPPGKGRSNGIVFEFRK